MQSHTRSDRSRPSSGARGRALRPTKVFGLGLGAAILVLIGGLLAPDSPSREVGPAPRRATAPSADPREEAVRGAPRAPVDRARASTLREVRGRREPIEIARRSDGISVVVDEEVLSLERVTWVP